MIIIILSQIIINSVKLLIYPKIIRIKIAQKKKTNIKNNYNIYFINSKLIQRNDDKNINSINNINNNESSRVLYDSVNKKMKNINELNSSNNKS